MKKSNRTTPPLFAALIVVNVLWLQTTNAQTVVLQRTTENTKPSNRGPNLKKHTQAYLTLGLAASPDHAGAEIVYGSSAEMSFGLRSKYKIGSVFSFGWNLGIEYTDFKLRQIERKTLPSPTLFKVQRLDFSYVRLGFFNRFNIDPSRGNVIGKFLELGLNGKYAYSVSEIQKYNTTNGNARTEISSLKYVQRWHGDVYAQIGSGHLSLWATWRLTDLFKPNYNYPDLPRLTAGIEIGF